MIFTPATIQNRQTQVAKQWDKILKPSDAVVVLCGEPIQKPGGLDQAYPFLPHPAYYWLTGRRRYRGAIVFQPGQGWTEFTQPYTREEFLWEHVSTDEKAANDIETLSKCLSSCERVFVLGALTASTLMLPRNASPETAYELTIALDQIRRIKDSEEIAFVEKSAKIAYQGYQRLKEIIRPGISEREIQIEYESTIFKAGAQSLPYETIVGSGPNAAVLHAVPTSRIVQPSDWVLIDAGAEVHEYCVDITRVFPANGSFSSRQQTIYDLVKQAQAKAIEKCLAGEEWHNVHLTAARVIAEGLKDLKLIRSDVDSALESGAISVFFPHGVGHLVGLKVRDTGNLENRAPRKYAGAALRIDLKLQENSLVTVEPGCYFIDSLLNDRETRERFSQFIDWNAIESWKGFGGVRIEDDILITRSGPRNLTSIVEK